MEYYNKLSFKDLKPVDHLEESGLTVNIGTMISFVLIGQKNYHQAHKILNRVAKKLAQYPVGQVHLKVYMKLGELSERFRDYPLAVKYFNRYVSIFEKLDLNLEDPVYREVFSKKEKYRNILKAKASKDGIPPMLYVKYPWGDVEVFDRQTSEWVVSTLPDPTQASLNEIASECDKIIILKQERENENSNQLVKRTQLEITDPSQIHRFFKAIEINEEKEIGHIPCNGSFLFSFCRKGKEIEEVEYVIEGAIRMKHGWKDDAILKNPMSFLILFEELGIPELKKEYQQHIRQQQSNEDRLNFWLAQSPKTFHDFFKENRVDPGQFIMHSAEVDKSNVKNEPYSAPDLDSLGIYNALTLELGDNLNVLKALISSFGIMKEWNIGYSFENLPLQILMHYPIDRLLSEIEQIDLTDELKEGLAKFFTSWYFYKNRAGDYKMIPELLKSQLFEFVQNNKGKFEQKIIQRIYLE